MTRRTAAPDDADRLHRRRDLAALRFEPAETRRAYALTLRKHVLAHGVPLAFYSDRHGIFRVNAQEFESGAGLTALNRVTERLGITQTCATTPQAKGHVERANQTLRHRLIKEMRLMGIRDVATAEAFLPDTWLWLRIYESAA